MHLNLTAVPQTRTPDHTHVITQSYTADTQQLQKKKDVLTRNATFHGSLTVSSAAGSGT